MKVVKSSKKEEKDFTTKWKEHKEQYLKDHSVESMVYENGTALALIYKELQRLNTNLMNNIKENGKEDN